MTIQITNTGGDVRAVLVGDPESPDTVKLLQPGESFASDAAAVTVNDGASVKDRRGTDQNFAGRRVADPRVDQRQVNREQSRSTPSAADRAGSQYSGGVALNPNDASGGAAQAGATTNNVNDPAARGYVGTAATNPNTSDGSNVPKNSAGEHLT